MTELLELKNISKVYSRGLRSQVSTTALQDISLTIKAEEPTIMTVAGESGSGKTTLAMLLLGFINPTSGQILYKGRDIHTLRGEEHMTFRREVQAVFQDPFAVFNPFYTVDHLLTVPVNRFKLAKSKSEAMDKMVEALTAVGLRPGDVLGRFPHQLSGGQRHRINVARALVLRPKLLVADEPVSMVDASLRANILETLRGLQKNYGVSIIYITHPAATPGSAGACPSGQRCYRLAEWVVPPYVEDPPGSFVDAAFRIKQSVSIPVIVSGKIFSPALGESTLPQGMADMVAFGRQMLVNDRFGRFLYEGGANELKQCTECYTCLQCLVEGGPVECPLNPGLFE